MLNEKQIANKIFDAFRITKCKVGQGVMMQTLTLSLYRNLNPKEQEIFNEVYIGLQLLKYIEVKNDNFLVLTDKGYDFIYDDEKVAHFLEMPWILPNYHLTDWNKAYNHLWKVIGKSGECPAYITGPKFLTLASSVCSTLPPSYNQYYEERKNKGLSLSRVDFFRDLLDSVNDEDRYNIYITIQNYIDESKEEPTNTTQIVPIEDLVNPILREKLERDISRSEDSIAYVSYSWSQSSEMDSICNCLEDAGVRYKRDKKDCGYLHNIKKFEDEIVSGKKVIAIISDKYLRSIHCMYEMCYLIAKGGMEDRLFPIVYISSFSALDLEEYKKYWNEEFEKRREIVSTQPAGGLMLAIEELLYCDTIVRELPKLWKYLAEHNTLTPDVIKADDYRILIEKLKVS